MFNCLEISEAIVDLPIPEADPIKITYGFIISPLEKDS